MFDMAHAAFRQQGRIDPQFYRTADLTTNNLRRTAQVVADAVGQQTGERLESLPDHGY